MRFVRHIDDLILDPKGRAAPPFQVALPSGVGGSAAARRAAIPSSRSRPPPRPGNLVDGAYSLACFGDVATEICIRTLVAGGPRFDEAGAEGLGVDKVFGTPRETSFECGQRGGAGQRRVHPDRLLGPNGVPEDDQTARPSHQRWNAGRLGLCRIVTPPSSSGQDEAAGRS